MAAFVVELDDGLLRDAAAQLFPGQCPEVLIAAAVASAVGDGLRGRSLEPGTHVEVGGCCALIEPPVFRRVA